MIIYIYIYNHILISTYHHIFSRALSPNHTGAVLGRQDTGKGPWSPARRSASDPRLRPPPKKTWQNIHGETKKQWEYDGILMGI